MKKLRLFDIICIAIILSGVIGGLLLPVTGPAVLLDEVCSGITVLGAGIWCVKFAVLAWKTGKNRLLCSALAAVLLLVSIVITKDAMLDFVSGSKTVILKNCSVENRSTTKGITSLDYYLIGTTADGTKYSFEVSGKDYQYLTQKTTVTVNGYTNTGRIISYQ